MVSGEGPEAWVVPSRPARDSAEKPGFVADAGRVDDAQLSGRGDKPTPIPESDVVRSASGGNGTNTAALEAAATLLRLDQELARLARLAPTERLVLPADATVTDLRRAFVKTARPFHPDRYRRYARDDLTERAQEIYLLLSEAETALRSQTGPALSRGDGRAKRANRRQ